MFTLTCAVRIATAMVVEKKIEKTFRTIEEARNEAESISSAVAYRVFDKTGFRVYSKKIEKRS